MPDITVSSGQSIVSIAKDHGFFWETLWKHGGNGGLRAARSDPNVLYEGDVVHVPEITKKHESRPTEARHVFKRKGDPVKYRLQLMHFGSPRANEGYLLEIGGERIEGTTDGDGKLEEFLPGNSTSGRLLLRDGEEVYPVRVNRLDPADTITGAQQRLRNLGYPVPRATGKADEATRTAIAAFQERQGLESTGELDASTASAIEAMHP